MDVISMTFGSFYTLKNKYISGPSEATYESAPMCWSYNND